MNKRMDFLRLYSGRRPRFSFYDVRQESDLKRNYYPPLGQFDFLFVKLLRAHSWALGQK